MCTVARYVEPPGIATFCRQRFCPCAVPSPKVAMSNSEASISPSVEKVNTALPGLLDGWVENHGSRLTRRSKDSLTAQVLTTMTFCDSEPYGFNDVTFPLLLTFTAVAVSVFASEASVMKS